MYGAVLTWLYLFGALIHVGADMHWTDFLGPANTVAPSLEAVREAERELKYLASRGCVYESPEFAYCDNTVEAALLLKLSGDEMCQDLVPIPCGKPEIDIEIETILRKNGFGSPSRIVPPQPSSLKSFTDAPFVLPPPIPYPQNNQGPSMHHMADIEIETILRKNGFGSPSRIVPPQPSSPKSFTDAPFVLPPPIPYPQNNQGPSMHHMAGMTGKSGNLQHGNVVQNNKLMINTSPHQIRPSINPGQRRPLVAFVPRHYQRAQQTRPVLQTRANPARPPVNFIETSQFAGKFSSQPSVPINLRNVQAGALRLNVPSRQSNVHPNNAWNTPSALASRRQPPIIGIQGMPFTSSGTPAVPRYAFNEGSPTVQSIQRPSLELGPSKDRNEASTFPIINKDPETPKNDPLVQTDDLNRLEIPNLEDILLARIGLKESDWNSNIDDEPQNNPMRQSPVTNSGPIQGLVNNNQRETPTDAQYSEILRRQQLNAFTDRRQRLQQFYIRPNEIQRQQPLNGPQATFQQIPLTNAPQTYTMRRQVPNVPPFNAQRRQR